MDISDYIYYGDIKPSELRDYFDKKRWHNRYVRTMKIASLIALFVFMGIAVWTAQMVVALAQLPVATYILN